MPAPQDTQHMAERGPAPPLARFARFRTHDQDEAREAGTTLEDLVLGWVRETPADAQQVTT